MQQPDFTHLFTPQPDFTHLFTQKQPATNKTIQKGHALHDLHTGKTTLWETINQARTNKTIARISLKTLLAQTYSKTKTEHIIKQLKHAYPNATKPNRQSKHKTRHLKISWLIDQRTKDRRWQKFQALTKPQTTHPPHQGWPWQ